MLDYRLQAILKQEFYGSVSDVESLAKKIGIDKFFLIKQIRELNNFLKKQNHEEFLLIDNKVYTPKKITFSWAEMKLLLSKNEIVFSELERQRLIFLFCFLEIDNLSVFHFQDFLQVSKNTILADIKKLRKLLKEEGILLEYQRKNGFLLLGDELKIRVFGKNIVSMLLIQHEGYWGIIEIQNKLHESNYFTIEENLGKVLEEQNLNVVPSRKEEVAHYMTFLTVRIKNHPICFLPKDIKVLEMLHVSQSVKSFVKAMPEFDSPNEEFFLASLFVTVIEGAIRDDSLDYLWGCANEIVKRFQTISAIQLLEEEETLKHTFYHLVPAFFRIYFGYHLSNALTQTIKYQHEELFKLTQIALEPLEKLTKKKTPDNEIAYFTILFGGEIKRQKEIIPHRIRALILCPNGISSSLIMKEELKQLFPSIEFNLTKSVKELSDISENTYDVIFTNTPLASSKPTYLIQPIMTFQEKQNLLSSVQEELLMPGMVMLSPNKIIKVIEPYIKLKEGVTKEKLIDVLTKKISLLQKKKEDTRPMLSELITLDTIELTEEKLEWQEAIARVAKPLLEQGKIEERYVTAMINKVKEYGAFIHIGKNLALPHARPEDGVNELSMSLLKTTKPVLLLDDQKHPIHVFICLAAIDNEAHLRALGSLTKVLSNKKSLEDLLAANTKEEIINILKGEDE